MRETKYSYSRMECYENCPFSYYLKYVKKCYPTTGSIALEFGTAVHSTEEQIGNYLKAGEPVPYQQLIENFANRCMEIEQKYPNDFKELDKSNRTYADKINFYCNTGIYRLENYLKAHPELELVGTEVKIEFNFENIELFGGSIDRVLRNKITGKYIIQDIKTYNVEVEPERLVTPLQFVTYCLGLSKLYGCKLEDIECSYDLPLCDLIQPAGTTGFIARGCKKLRKLFDNIYDNNWVPKPTALCHWCSYCASNASAGEDTKYLCPFYCKWLPNSKTMAKETEWQTPIGKEKKDGIAYYIPLLEAYIKINNYPRPKLLDEKLK